MLRRGHRDSAEVFTLGEVAAGWHRGCSPMPTPSRGRWETEALTKSSWRPLPSHSWNFSKMQIPLWSMQTNPQSQGCLPWGPTTITMAGLTGPPKPGCLAWGSEPAGVTSCFPTSDSLSSPGDLGSPAGSGVLEVARGPWGEKAPFHWALSDLTFGDTLNGHYSQPKALEGGLAP